MSKPACAELLLGFVTSKVWVCICNMLVCFCFFCSKESENDEVFVRHSQVGIFGFFCFSFVGSEQAFY